MGHIGFYIQLWSLLIVPLVLAITIHEAAHGWTAWRLGDSTARDLGRVTFNPIKHIDPVGTIAVPLAILAVTTLAGQSLIFGWAKPVPVQPHRLNSPRRDMALVALAGPGINLLMAVGWALALQLGLVLASAANGTLGSVLVYMSAAGVIVNIALMALNMLPLLPLDGGRVVRALLPPRLGERFARIEPYGLLVLIALLATGVLGTLLGHALVLVVGLMPGSDDIFGYAYELFSML